VAAIASRVQQAGRRLVMGAAFDFIGPRGFTATEALKSGQTENIDSFIIEAFSAPQ
jgi:hypothetical protein